MTENALSNMGEDDRVAQVMIHTNTGLSWGQMVHKQAILPERILTGSTVPDYITLYDAQTITAQGNSISKPIKYSEFHIPYDIINAFHLMPPNEAQLDYDPAEPNRIMVPIIAHVGAFIFNANIRISNQTSVGNSLRIAKADFISVYDIEVYHPSNPNMKPIQTNYALLRRMQILVGLNS
jgi:hypothetical protein